MDDADRSRLKDSSGELKASRQSGRGSDGPSSRSGAARGAGLPPEPGFPHPPSGAGGDTHTLCSLELVTGGFLPPATAFLLPPPA